MTGKIQFTKKPIADVADLFDYELSMPSVYSTVLEEYNRQFSPHVFIPPIAPTPTRQRGKPMESTVVEEQSGSASERRERKKQKTSVNVGEIARLHKMLEDTRKQLANSKTEEKKAKAEVKALNSRKETSACKPPDNKRSKPNPQADESYTPQLPPPWLDQFRQDQKQIQEQQRQDQKQIQEQMRKQLQQNASSDQQHKDQVTIAEQKKELDMIKDHEKTKVSEAKLQGQLEAMTKSEEKITKINEKNTENLVELQKKTLDMLQYIMSGGSSAISDKRNLPSQRDP
jgi:hypothetical protein